VPVVAVGLAVQSSFVELKVYPEVEQVGEDVQVVDVAAVPFGQVADAVQVSVELATVVPLGH
jgi:uncharacterized membrane protein